MFDNRVLASVVAGIPVSLLCLAYVAVRRDDVVRLLTEGGDADPLSPGAATALAIAGSLAIGPGLGLAAALVRGWVPSDGMYLALAALLATALSVAAVAGRTPLMVEKIVLNYAVALMLGLVAPRLVAG